MKELATPYSTVNYPKAELKINNLHNMFITRSMLVGNIKGDHSSCLVPNIPDGWKKKINFTFFGSLLKNKLHFLDNKNYYFISHIWGNGYHHWLTEVAPKLFLFEEEIKEGILLFPLSTPNFIREFLEAWEFNNVEFYRDNCFVRKIQVIDNPNSGHYDKNLLLEFKKKVLQKVGNQKTGVSNKVYVSRKNSTKRKVLNEKELCNKLERAGFSCIETDKMSLFDEVNIFRSCDYLISLHGAGLTNLLFMPDGSKIVEFFPQYSRETDLNACYYRLSKVLGHEYKSIWCQREFPKKEFKLDTDNIIVDIDNLFKELKLPDIS